MKNKSFIVLFFLLIGSNVFAYVKLDAFLESNPVCRMGVYLVFQNHTDAYILLPTTFDNLTRGGEPTERLSTIKMKFYNNGQHFTLTRQPRWLPPFTFHWGSVDVAPHSEVRLPFHIGEYNFPFLSECEIERLEVRFFIGYLFFLLVGDENNPSPMNWVSAVTNSVRIITPIDEIAKDERETANEEEHCYWGVCLICRGLRLME